MNCNANKKPTPLELHAALKQLARSRRLTLSELMTAAGEALVRQYSQQPF